MWETLASMAGFGVARQASLMAPSSGWHRVRGAAAACFHESPSLALPFTRIFEWAPQGGSTPSPTTERAHSPSPSWGAAGSWLSAPCTYPWPGGWQCWTQHGAEGAATESKLLAAPSSYLLCRAKVPFAAEQPVELQSPWSCRARVCSSAAGTSRSPQPSGERSLNTAHLEKAQAGRVSFL